VGRSRFVDGFSSNSTNPIQTQPGYQRGNQLLNGSEGIVNPLMANPNLDKSDFMNNSQYQTQQFQNQQLNQQQQLQQLQQNESNQMFEKILSEVIHVSAFEPHSYLNNDSLNHPVQDMPYKIKGLLEPNKQQQLTLPEGVPAPLNVLIAQPPFAEDIQLINTMANEAQMCINNYTLFVPDNVAFDFKPVV
jgi:hypothetical protein